MIKQNARNLTLTQPSWPAVLESNDQKYVENQTRILSKQKYNKKTIISLIYY